MVKIKDFQKSGGGAARAPHALHTFRPCLSILKVRYFYFSSQSTNTLSELLFDSMLTILISLRRLLYEYSFIYSNLKFVQVYNT